MAEAYKVKFVGVSFPMNLGEDVLVVVVAQCAAQLVVVHVGLGLPLAPAARHLVRVGQLELAGVAVPRDAAGVTGVGEKLQQELPQLDLAGACVEPVGELVNHPVIEKLVLLWVECRIPYWRQHTWVSV